MILIQQANDKAIQEENESNYNSNLSLPIEYNVSAGNTSCNQKRIVFENKIINMNCILF